jgi:hypothetical protein
VDHLLYVKVVPTAFAVGEVGQIGERD